MAALLQQPPRLRRQRTLVVPSSHGQAPSRGLLGEGATLTRLGDDPEKASRGGWYFPASDPDPLCGATDLRGVYNECTEGGEYSGRCTAPLLVDLQAGTIISNESGDIIRMLNALDIGGGAEEEELGVIDLYPPELRAQIDQTNEWTYELINNGVYRAGFATRQAAYEQAEGDVHAGLARCNAILAERRFLCGETVTEADVRLLPTACRFDGVYATFFRCGRRLIRSDYQYVARWLGDLLRLTGPSLFDLDAARRSYYSNLFPLNPGGIVPMGPTAADLGMPVDPVGSASSEVGAFTWR